MSAGPVAHVGSKLGPYRIEAVLGRGGMGVVYLATDVRLGRSVALKVLAPELSDNERFRVRFERESRMAASVEHPGIVPVYDAGEVDGLLYIAMRYVDGTDLQQLLADGPLEPGQALDILGQLADALDAAHEHGLVHRDVKPSNVLVARERDRTRVYLADFGLTRTSGSSLTASGELLGTVSYMAPEVIRGEQPGPAADLYALGCVMLECLTGDAPYHGPNDAAVMYAHLEADPPRAADRVQALPPAIDPVIERALAKEPGERWPSGRALVEAARFALGGGAPAAVRPRRPRVTLPALAGAALLLLAVLVVGAVVREGAGGHEALPTIRARSVALIDPGPKSLLAQVPMPGTPTRLAGGAGALWVIDRTGGTLSRIDIKTSTIRQTIDVGHGPSALAVEPRGVWVADAGDGAVVQVSPQTNQRVGTPTHVGASAGGICVTDGAIWVADPVDLTVARIDPNTGRKTDDVPLDVAPSDLVCTGRSVWASSATAGSVTQISAPARAVVRTVPTGGGASGLAVGAGALWVANTLDGTVARVDPRRAVVTATIPIGANAAPTGLAVVGTSVWVADDSGSTLTRIDARRAAITDKLALGVRAQGIAAIGERLWVAAGDRSTGHRGGDLRVASNARLRPADLDPALAATPLAGSVISLTNDGLTAFRHVSGASGATIVPDLAIAVPPASDNGSTYAFQLRGGVHYSDGTPVRASDVRRGIERAMRLARPPREALSSFVGARSCSSRRCDLSRGIVTDDAAGTVVLHLTHPDDDLPYKLALPFAVAIPPGVGGRIRRADWPLPATGPYMVGHFTPRRVLRLVRNPRFRPWSPAAKPGGYVDSLTIRSDVSVSEGARLVARNSADWVAGPQLHSPFGSRATPLERRYPSQLHSGPQAATAFEWLNTRVAPFDRVDARRAVAAALDRSAIIALQGGKGSGTPTCRLIPPPLPGYSGSCPPRRDLAAARRLVERSGTKGARVTVWGFDGAFAKTTDLIARTLRAIGYRARARLRGDDYWSYTSDSRHRAQMGVQFWAADYPAASALVRDQLSCSAFARASPDNLNMAENCDPEADRLMAEAAHLQTADPARAAAMWARVDRMLVDRAVIVPLYNPANVDFVSRRVGNYQYNPQGGLLLDQLWVR
jgi:ABC-type transport system substrate-binding protein/predicted Ser/Thr protein kinase